MVGWYEKHPNRLDRRLYVRRMGEIAAQDAHHILLLLLTLQALAELFKPRRGAHVSSGIVDRVAGAVVWIFEPSTRVAFLLVKAEYTRGNDDATRKSPQKCVGQRGSSWCLDASSPRKQVVNVVDVVDRKSVCACERGISGSGRASGCGLYFWCVVHGEEIRPFSP
jgi:hypothetical protein